ncbi:hypothetical protein CH35J_005113 [Colletotrichum higginsianum]|uniref:DUF5672 domain-containing protein n=1 Tax=Colletotrichum higginsianum TaxID=80884 RepID=A0A4T0W450_9PEZI|nr:hypothetical protein CH35J_005113 [Colletotrichum higginsianum]
MGAVTKFVPSTLMGVPSRQKALYPLLSITITTIILIIITLLAGRETLHSIHDANAVEAIPHLDTETYHHLIPRSSAQSRLSSGDGFYTSNALHTFEKGLQEDRPSGNVAVLMETNTSAVPNLVPIVLHFASVLGPNWPIVLVTLESTWVVPESPAFRRLMDANQIRITYLPATTNISDHHSVSVFLTEPWFWEQFVSSHRMLIFQVDSILCSKAPMTMEDFLEWDLVGAPITVYGIGYNGGLSLRNPRLMLDIVNDPSVSLGPRDYEDQWFYARAQERGAHLPNTEQALKFAVETTYYKTPLGYHRPKPFQGEHWDEITEWCPEVGLLWGHRFTE